MNASCQDSSAIAPEGPGSESMPPPDKVTVPQIFIVDDDGAVRAALRALVRSFGWHEHVYASGREFLEGYAAGENGCLVLDLHMPDMNGAEVQEQLRERGIDLPVIIITAFGDDPLVERARAAGARAVLAKPLQDDELLESILKALDDSAHPA